MRRYVIGQFPLLSATFKSSKLRQAAEAASDGRTFSRSADVAKTVSVRVWRWACFGDVGGHMMEEGGRV